MPSEDELLDGLRKAARAEADDARWEDLAAGRLSPEQVAALEREAEHDDEIAAMLAATRPLSGEAKTAIVSRIEPLVAGGAAKVVPIAARGRRAVIVAVGAAAMAAAVALAVLRSRGEGAESTWPAYALVAAGGDRAVRGDAPAPATDVIVLDPDSRLELTLRPATRAKSAPVVRAFLVQGGAARPWSPPMRVSADGAVLVAGTAAEILGPTRGTVDLVFAIGADDAVPADPAVVARAVNAGRGGEGWQLLVQRVRVTGAP